MNESCLVESHRTIDIDKLSTQFTCNFLRDSVIFKDSKNKIFEEICAEKVFQQMIHSNLTTKNKINVFDENFSDERNSIFTRLKKLSKQLRLSYQTLHLVFYYIDTIIASCGKFVNITLENIALGSLSLAIKFNEYDENENLPMLDELGNLFYSGSAEHNIKDFKNFELFCLDKLEYKLNLVTPWTVIEFMIANGIFFNDEQKYTLNSKNEKNYGDPVYKLAKEIIEYTLEDYSYFYYSSVQIACSCVALVREIMEADTLWSESIEGIYKLKLDEFITCFNYVKTKYFKVKNSKKGRDSSIGRKIKRVITEPEVTCNSSPEIQILKEATKKQPYLSKKDSLESFKLKSSQKNIKQITILKRSQIPKGNNENRNLNKIISPFAKNNTVKTVTLTNKNLIPIAKEYSFQTKNLTILGVPLQTVPNLNTTHYNLTTSHNSNNNNSTLNKAPIHQHKSSRLNTSSNKQTLEKELLHKKLKELQERERKLNSYRLNSSKILQRTFSDDKYKNYDSKYLENFYNNLRVYSVEKSSNYKNPIDRNSVKKEGNNETLKNNGVFQTNKSLFSQKVILHDHNLKTNITSNTNRNSNINSLKQVPVSLKTSRTNTLISVASAKNLIVKINTTDKKLKNQPLSKLPSQKVLRTINRKVTQIFNGGRESFGTKSENMKQ